MEKTPENLGQPEIGPELKEKLELFRENLMEGAVVLAEEGIEIEEGSAPERGETLLQNIEAYEDLEKHEELVMDVLKRELGFDTEKLEELFVKEYLEEGTPGTPGEGEIKVKVFKTNNPKVFVARYEYPDGGVCWSIQPGE